MTVVDESSARSSVPILADLHLPVIEVVGSFSLVVVLFIFADGSSVR
jgi:hypothetical protein